MWLLVPVLFLISCTPQESITTAESEIEALELGQVEQEVKNRLFFLEEFVGIENLTTENFPSVYQGIFDPLPQNNQGVGRNNCTSCGYVSTSCENFGLYLVLLETSCSTQLANSIDFCALYESCSQCCIQTCPYSECFPEVDEVDACGNICPDGFDCLDGVCVDNRTDCEINEDLIADYSRRPRYYWANECGVPVSEVRIVNRGLYNDVYLTTWTGTPCPALMEYYRLQWKKVFCDCNDRGFEDFCDCIC